MADNPLGASFLPGADQGLNQGTVPGGLSPQAQQAIQFLSLRLPRVVGAQAVSPQALLQPQVGQANTNHDLASAVVRSVLAALGHPVPLGGPSAAGDVLGGAGSALPAPTSAPTAAGTSSPFGAAVPDPGLGTIASTNPVPHVTIGNTGDTTPQPPPPSVPTPTAQPTLPDPGDGMVKLATSDLPRVPMGGGGGLSGGGMDVPDEPRGLGRSFV